MIRDKVSLNNVAKKDRLTFQKSVSSSYINKEGILTKYVRIVVNLTALKSNIKSEFSDIIRKMESLTNGASNGYLCQSCKNMKGNLSFLQKELLAKNEFIKSLLETQTAILNSLSNSALKIVSCHHHLTVLFKMQKKIWKIKQINKSLKSANPSKKARKECE